MNDKTSQGNSTDRDDETVERLLRLAGPRAAIPDEIEARVYDRVHQEWRASSQPPDGARVYQFVRREWEKDTTRRRYRRWALPVTIAASVVLAVAVILQPLSREWSTIRDPGHCPPSVSRSMRVRS
jgi:negative regulator of sigma E activity